jgi:hypothetical protein
VLFSIGQSAIVAITMAVTFIMAVTQE